MNEIEMFYLSQYHRVQSKNNMSRSKSKMYVVRFFFSKGAICVVCMGAQHQDIPATYKEKFCV